MKPTDEVAQAVITDLAERRTASRWALPAATGPAAPTPGQSARLYELGAGIDCPLCKGAGWLKRYLNGTDILGGSELVPCVCKSKELRHKAWERARRASNIGGVLQWLNLDNFDVERQPEAFQAASDFATDPERAWLVLAGEVGTGKSHLLAAIVNRLLTTKWHPVYHVLPELLRHLRQGFDAGDYQQRWDDLRKAEVLLLDDYGSEQPTPWGDETLFVLVDYRWAHRMPTVVATNLTAEQMPARIASRLHDQARSRVVTMRPGDYRRSEARMAERGSPVPQAAPGDPWDE
jgi:DNA replication protein DnaC